MKKPAEGPLVLIADFEHDFGNAVVGAFEEPFGLFDSELLQVYGPPKVQSHLYEEDFGCENRGLPPAVQFNEVKNQVEE